MIKKLLVLLILIGILVSGCVTQKEGKTKKYDLTEVLNTSDFMYLQGIHLYLTNRTVEFPDNLRVVTNNPYQFDRESYSEEIEDVYGGNYTIILVDKSKIKYLEFPFHLSEYPIIVLAYHTTVSNSSLTTITLPYNSFFGELIILYNNKTVKIYNSSNLDFYHREN